MPEYIKHRLLKPDHAEIKRSLKKIFNLKMFRLRLTRVLTKYE